MLGVSMLSVIAVFPFLLTTQGDALRKLPIVPPLIFLASALQSMVLLSIAIFVGLLLGKKVGFGAPYISAWINKMSIDTSFSRVAKRAVAWGIGVGVAIIVVDRFFSLFLEPVAVVTAPAWQGLLAAFYGGVVEEVLLRFCLMTVLIWIFFKISKSKNTPSSIIVWLAIVIAAVLFGLLHLPATALIYTITPLVVARAIILNSIGGIVFGWLYWKKGFESAVIAHFSADIVLYVLLPLVISTL